MRHSTSKCSVTLITAWVRGCSRSLKMAPLDRPYGVYDFLFVRHCKHSSILYSFFSYLTLNNIATLNSGLEITQGHSNWTIRKLGCGAVSYSPFVVTMALSSIISKKKRDIGRKSSFFHTPLALDAPVRWAGSLRRNIAISFGLEN